MSLTVQITVPKEAEAWLRKRVAELTNRRPINAAIGKREEKELRAYFLKRQDEPNKPNLQGVVMPKQQFWTRIRGATLLGDITEESATVSISDPAFNQKFYGGTITPKEGRSFLAIPQVAEAVGRSPLVAFPRVYGPPRAPGRKVSDAVKAIPLKKDGVIWYWLVRAVKQTPDPRALPPNEQLQEAMLAESRAYFTRADASA